jgi:tetraacyldisaccharide-1-P 4'-kinase
VSKRLGRPGDGFLTTEKDAINLASDNLASELHRLEPLAVARLQLTLDDPTTAVDTILARIAKRQPRS